MTGTLTGTRALVTGTGTSRNARERSVSFSQVDDENGSGTHENAPHGNGNRPPVREVPVCACGAATAGPGYHGHAMHCLGYWREEGP
jgi:hypothetical protein